jgi:hypothetical protein
VEAFWGFSDLLKHTGKDLKAQVLLIAQTISTALKELGLKPRPFSSPTMIPIADGIERWA